MCTDCVYTLCLQVYGNLVNIVMSVFFLFVYQGEVCQRISVQVWSGIVSQRSANLTAIPTATRAQVRLEKGGRLGS